MPPATALIPGGWVVETSSTALPPCSQCGKAAPPPHPRLPPQASWPCSESTQQAAHNFKENLSHVRCFPFDSQKLCKGIVFSRNASSHRLRSQLSFPFLISSEISRLPSLQRWYLIMALPHLGWLWSFSNRDKRQVLFTLVTLVLSGPWLHPPAIPRPLATRWHTSSLVSFLVLHHSRLKGSFEELANLLVPKTLESAGQLN